MTTQYNRQIEDKKHVAKMFASFGYYKVENNFSVSAEELLVELASPRYVNHWEVSTQNENEGYTLVVELAYALGANFKVYSGRYHKSVTDRPGTDVSFYTVTEAVSFLHKWVGSRLN
jgi:hypothetical protein